MAPALRSGSASKRRIRDTTDAMAMHTRTFLDSEGRCWQAWDVLPGEHLDWPEKARRHLPASMTEGWLCFESDTLKRRMHPIPPEWEGWTDDEIRLRCAAAEPVLRRSA